MDNIARVNLARSSFPNRVEQLTKPVVDSPKGGDTSPHIRALHSWLDSEKFEVKNGCVFKLFFSYFDTANCQRKYM